MVKKYIVTLKKGNLILLYINSTFSFSSTVPVHRPRFFCSTFFSSQLFYLLINNVLSMSAFFLQFTTLFPIDIFYFSTFCPSRRMLHSMFFPVDVSYFFLSSTFCPSRRFFYSTFVPFRVFLSMFCPSTFFYRRRFFLRRLVGESDKCVLEKRAGTKKYEKEKVHKEWWDCAREIERA